MAEDTEVKKGVKQTQASKAKKSEPAVAPEAPKNDDPQNPLHQPWFPWVLAVIALLIGIIGGFLGGVAVGERGDLRYTEDLPFHSDSDWHRDMNRGSFWQ